MILVELNNACGVLLTWSESSIQIARYTIRWRFTVLTPSNLSATTLMLKEHGISVVLITVLESMELHI